MHWWVSAYIGGPEHEPNTWGPDLTVGGGMDYNTPLFNHHLAIRLFQADYEYMHADFGPEVRWPRQHQCSPSERGLVWHVRFHRAAAAGDLRLLGEPDFGLPWRADHDYRHGRHAEPQDEGCLHLDRHRRYGFGRDGKVDTASLAPGSYTVKGNVSEGPKAGQSADCSATFTVKAFEPPTVSCSANPTTIKPGDTSAITATGVSPQNRPLTYSYSASAGSVSGTGNSAPSPRLALRRERRP
jgi:hypothetical protein